MDNIPNFIILDNVYAIIVKFNAIFKLCNTIFASYFTTFYYEIQFFISELIYSFNSI